MQRLTLSALLIMLSYSSATLSCALQKIIPQKLTVQQKLRLFYHNTKRQLHPEYQEELNRKLLTAVNTCNFSDVQLWCTAGADPNTTDQFGQTPLVLAFYHRLAAYDPFDPEAVAVRRDEYLAIIKYLLSFTQSNPDVIIDPITQETLVKFTLLHGDNIVTALLLVHLSSLAPCAPPR